MSTTPFITRHDDDNHELKRFTRPIMAVLAGLVAIPLYIALHRVVPNPFWPYHADRILLAVGVIGTVWVLFAFLKTFILIAFVLSLGYLLYGDITGGYGHENLYTDYRALIFSLKDTPDPEEFIAANIIPFPNKSKIKKAMDFENPTVRNFALLATGKHFKDYQRRTKYRTIIQCFAIFKEINNNWNYVSDPKSREYLAAASESTEHLSGDCDDHSILMAACIKAVGGIPRIIYTTGHLYPEILIGDQTDLEALNYLIREKLFRYETGNDGLHYHIDEHGHIWLNLDYTANYPGGAFLNEEILGVLNLE